MMKYYLEMTLLPNSDINLFTLWSTLFGQIHLGLVEIQDDQGYVPIGISFPEYVVGDKFSVLGGNADYSRMMKQHCSVLIRKNALNILKIMSIAQVFDLFPKN